MVGAKISYTTSSQLDHELNLSRNSNTVHLRLYHPHKHHCRMTSFKLPGVSHMLYIDGTTAAIP
jgi:hypothetical protein